MDYLKNHRCRVVPAVLLLSLFTISHTHAQEFKAIGIENYGDITVMEVEGNYDAIRADGSINTLPREKIAKTFFETHPDSYDFLIIFSNFDFSMPEEEVVAFYCGVKNEVQGIGIPLFDNSENYGSDGKLQGTIDMGTIATIASDPLDTHFSFTMSTLSHEFLHRWAARVKFKKADGGVSAGLLGREGNHWSYLLDTGGSVLYGNRWRDNGNGTFTSRPGRKYYSTLDLYLMGLNGASEVPPMLLIENAAINPEKLPEEGITIEGTPHYITFDEIMAAEGERVPDALHSQKSFKIGCILIVRSDTFVDHELYGIRDIIRNWVLWFSALTDGKATVVVDSTPFEDIPIRPDIKPPLYDPRDVPPEIHDGITWLINHQNEEGSWVDALQTVGRDTAEAVVALRSFAAAEENVAKGLQWLMKTSFSNADYLARKVEALALSGSTISPLLNELLFQQNPDGGWGSDGYYLSNPTDTSLVLKALASAEYKKEAVISSAIAYLKGAQHLEGGWGGDDRENALQTTATVLTIFAYYREAYQLDEQMMHGLVWLFGKQNADGGFGSSTSTIYETAIALSILKTLNASADSMTNAQNYILNLQSKDGSWYESPYQTALAVSGLWGAMREPDLSIATSDVSFTPPVLTSLPTEVVINGVVHNSGAMEVPQTTLTLYEGAIAQVNKLAEQSVSVPGQSSVTTTFTVNVTDGNAHWYYLTVDQENLVAESCETNNTALKILSPADEPTYDFEILPSGVSVSPGTVDLLEPVTINTHITNRAAWDVYNVPVRFSIDDPAGVFEIATVSLDIPAGESSEKSITWTAGKAGVNLKITAKVDPYNAYAELSESNNEASIFLTVNTSEQPNLTISYKDITISPSPAHEAGDVTITAVIKNNGASAADDIGVHFYRGVPGVDGVLIGSKTMVSLGAGESTTVNLDWMDIDEAGEKIIFIQLDPENHIQEIREDDNTAFTKLKIESLPDLVITSNSIVFTPPVPKDGDTVSIQVTVQNRGEQDALHVPVTAFEGTTLVDSGAIPLVSGNSQASLMLSYDTTGKNGAHAISIVVNPDNIILEKREDNNAASRSLGVQEADLWLTERYISPNGDGVKDSTQFFFRLASPQTVQVVVVNERGELVRTFSGGDFRNTTGATVTWDGLSDKRTIVADGLYQMEVRDEVSAIIARLPVTVDNNRSSLIDAIGSDYLLKSNLTCMLPEVWDWQWFPDESGILFHLGVADQDTPEYTTGLYTMSPDGDDILRIVPDEWSQKTDPLYDYYYGGYQGSFENGFSLSPNGEQVAFVLNKYNKSRKRSVLEQLWVVDRSGEHLRLLASYDLLQEFVRIENVTWSPDNSSIAYTTYSNTTRVYKLCFIKSDGTGETEVNYGSSWPRYLRWSPDGSELAYSAYGGEVSTIALANPAGNSRSIFEINGVLSWVEWFNNDTIIVCGDESPATATWLVDTSGSGNYQKVSEGENFFYPVEVAINHARPSCAFTDYSGSSWLVKVCDARGDCKVVHQTPLTTDASLGSSDIQWSGDGKKLAFIDYLYHGEVTQGIYDGYLIVIDMLTMEKKAFQVSDNVYVIPYSYHIWTEEEGEWVERGVLHYGADYKTQEMDLTQWFENSEMPCQVKITQQGKEAAHIDYIALSVQGRHYTPTGAINISTGENVVSKVSSRDGSVAGVHDTTVVCRWENVFPNGKISLVMNADEVQVSTGSILSTSHVIGNGENEVMYFRNGSLRWLDDDSSLMGQDSTGVFVINAEAGEKRYLPLGETDLETDAGLSPLGKYITYSQSVSTDGVCVGRSGKDLWTLRSLLNLTAELKPNKEKSAVVLKGSAADLNFLNFQLEYADIRGPEVWNLIAPPSDLPAVNEAFSSWIPPAEGTFYVRLTVFDLAGNRGWKRRRVSWGAFSSITNLYKTGEIFSPNGDGVNDGVELHYRVLEPVHLAFYIYNENGDLVRTFFKDYTAPPGSGGEDSITWDGRDEGGRVVADGSYTIKVFDYEFFFKVDTTPPVVNLAFSPILCTEEIGSLYAVLSGVAIDSNLKSWTVEYGEGDNPKEWYEYKTGAHSLGMVDSQGGVVKERVASFSGETLGFAAGRKFRITAVDGAGNKSATISEFLEEVLVLHKWGGNTLVLTKTKEGALVLKEGALPEGYLKPGINDLQCIETLRAPLTDVNVQYRKGEQWIDANGVMNPPSGIINLEWSGAALDQNKVTAVRIQAVDVMGEKHYSNLIPLTPPLFEIELCATPPGSDIGAPPYVGNAHIVLFEDLILQKLQVRGGEYAQWTDYRNLKPITTEFYPGFGLSGNYQLRMVGLGVSGTEYVSTMVVFPPLQECPSGSPDEPEEMGLSLVINYPEPECGKLSGRALVSVEAKGVLIQTLNYYMKESDAQGFQLLRSVERTGGITIDTTAMSEGSYPVKAVVKYIKSLSAGETELTGTLLVDHILPHAGISYPRKSAELCATKIKDLRGDWYGVETEGMATDNHSVNRYELYYGIGEHPAGWIPAGTRMGCDKGTVCPVSVKGSKQGMLATWDVTNLDRSVYTLMLKVIDSAGNVSCATTPVLIDRTVKLDVTADKKLFSPNGDEVADEAGSTYTFDEDAMVSVQVFEKILGSENPVLVRTIISEKPTPAGTETVLWDGKNDSGSAVTDGLYVITVTATDNCGNTRTKSTVPLEVDTTPPVVAITSPQSGSLYATMVEVTGTAIDQNFASYRLEVEEHSNPGTLYPVGSDSAPREDAVLGRWNNFGQLGLWKLKLNAADKVGNASETNVTVTIQERPQLIKELSAHPTFFSPNGDNLKETTEIQYELTEQCNVIMELFNESGVLKKIVYTENVSPGCHSYRWDGKDEAGVLVVDGSYTIMLTATLTSNTSVTQRESIGVVLDLTSPLIDFTNPLELSYLKDTVEVRGTIYDKNLTEYTISCEGEGGTVPLDAAQQNRENYTFATIVELAENTYVLEVQAKDAGEIITQKTTTFTIDRTPPKLTLYSPREGELYGSGKDAIEIRASIEEKHLERWLLRYGVGSMPNEWVELAEGESLPQDQKVFTWDVGRASGILDGVYTLSLSVRDRAGWEAEAMVKITVDNAPPVVAVLSPAEGSSIKEAVEIIGTASDQNLESYLVELSSGECSSAFRWASIATSTTSVENGILAILKMLPPDGRYCLRVTALDKVGNKAEVKTNLVVKTKPPLPPALTGEVIDKNDVSLSWSHNSEPDLAGYNLYRDGQKINSELITINVYLDQDLKEGRYGYTVKSVNNVGRESEPSNQVVRIIDLTPPEAQIRSPQDAALVNDLVEIRGVAYSADDFKEYRLLIGRGIAPTDWSLLRTSPVPTSYGTLAWWDTLSSAADHYSLRLEAEDLAGNISIDQVLVTVDNASPQAPLLLTALAEGSNVNLSWTASNEPDLAGYLLYRNGQLANLSGIVVGDVKPYLLSGTSYRDAHLPDGRFAYYLVVMDSAGNLSEQSNTVVVEIDTHSPQAIIVSPPHGYTFEKAIAVKAESSDLDIAQVKFQYKKVADSSWTDLGSPVVTQPFVIQLDPVSTGFTFGGYHLRAVGSDRGGRTDNSPSLITVIYTDLTPPDLPRELKALTDGSVVTLHWLANTESDLDGYNIYQVSGETKNKLNQMLIKTLNYLHSGLQNGLYTYEVAAVDTFGNESVSSQPVMAKVYRPVVNQPYTPVATSPLMISGTGAAGNGTVELFLDEGAGVEPQGTVAADGEGNFILNAGLTLGENRITVKATDSAGNISKPSDVVMVIYNQPPAPPTGLNAVVNGHAVTLTWNPNSEPDLSGYNLYRDGKKLNVPMLLNSGTSSASSNNNYALRAFDNNPASYWYGYLSDDTHLAWWEVNLASSELIRSLNIGWNESTFYGLCAAKDFEMQVWSGYAWITQAKVTDNENKVSVLDFSTPYRTDKIRLVMTAATTGTRVEIAEVSITKDVLIKGASYEDTNLHDGFYRYQVTAVDYYGLESLPSDEETASVGDVMPPAPPENLVATATGSDIILGWVANSEPDLAGYQVYQRSGAKWTKVHVGPVVANTYTHFGLLNGTYTYRVSAIDSVGNESLPSDEVSATVNVAPPPEPVNVVITPLPEGSALKICWDYSAEVPTGYNLYRSTTPGGPYSKVNDELITATCYLDEGLENSVTYYYVVVAEDSLGNEGISSSEVTSVPTDTVAPSEPVLFFPTVNGKPITVDQERVDIAGWAEPGASITLFRSEASLGKTTARKEDFIQSLPLEIVGISGVTISADGRTLIFAGYDASASKDAIWLKDLITGRVSKIISEGFSPQLSPDGKRLAYVYDDTSGNYRIGIYDLESGGTHNLTDDAAVNEDSPFWSHDGNKIIFETDRGGRNLDLWIKDLTIGTLTQITRGMEVRYAEFSPAGDKVAYYTYESLYLAHLASGDTTQIDDQISHYGDTPPLSWSPDGSRLGFISTRSGVPQVFSYELKNSGITQLTNVLNGVTLFSWSPPDGEHIVYATQVNNNFELWLKADGAQGESRLLTRLASSQIEFLSWIATGDMCYLASNTLYKMQREGYFSFSNIELKVGENSFNATATDMSGNESKTSEAMLIILDAAHLPDLETLLSDVYIYPLSPLAGEEVAVNVYVQNRGAVEAEDIGVNIYLWNPLGEVELLQSLTIPYLSPSSQELLNLIWDSTGKAGENTLIVEVDGDNTILEASEDNNFVARDFYVAATEGVAMSTALDKTSYRCHEDVFINVSLHNSGIEREGALEVQVEDEGGAIVAVVDTIVTLLPYGWEENYHLFWNTGTIYAGSYRVRAVLRDGDEVIAENTVLFTIVPDLRVTTVVSTDKTRYGANEEVMLEVMVEHNGENYSIPALEVRVAITTGDMHVLFEERKGVVNLLDGVPATVRSNWNTGFTSPGNYRVTAELYGDSTLLASDSTTFDINPSMPITGILKASPEVVSLGSEVQADYSVTNRGNVTAHGLSLTITIMNPNRRTVIDTKNEMVDLNQDETGRGQVVFSTQSYLPETYLMVLEYEDQGKNYLDADTFTVRDETNADDLPLDKLSGSLSAGPLQVCSGEEVSLHYTITSSADQDMGGLKVMVVIVDLNAGMVDRTFEQTITLPSLSTIHGDVTVPTSSVDPHSYQALLQMSIVSTPEPKTLGKIDYQAVPDSSPPQVEVTGVAEGRMYGVPVTPVISVSDCLLDTVNYFLDGAPYVPGTTISDVGEHILKVSALDKGGLTTEVTIHFTIESVDNSPPEITVSGVVDDACYGAEVTPVITVTDSNLDTVAITLNGDAFESGSMVVDEGEYLLHIEGKDKAGNTSMRDISFVIDKTPPVITIKGAVDGETYTDSVAPVIEVTDLHLTIWSAALNGEVFTSATTIVDPGDYTLVVEASDCTGNLSTVTVHFSIRIAYLYTISDFVIFAFNSASLNSNVHIASGDVGVLDVSNGHCLTPGYELAIDRNVYLGNGTTIYADTVQIGKNTSIHTVAYNELQNAGKIRGSLMTPLTLPLDIDLPEFQEPVPGTDDYYVSKNKFLTLGAGSYGEVVVSINSVLLLNGGTYHLENLTLAHNAVLLFKHPTNLIISGCITAEHNVYIGPESGSEIAAGDIGIFVNRENGDPDDPHSELRAVKIEHNALIIATIYAPRGTISIERNTAFKGCLIGKDILIDRNCYLSLDKD